MWLILHFFTGEFFTNFEGQGRLRYLRTRTPAQRGGDDRHLTCVTRTEFSKHSHNTKKTYQQIYT